MLRNRIRQTFPLKRKRRLTLQCDELWSFVGKKAHRQWIWLALDAETRLIVGCFAGSRDRSGAEGLWQSLPARYRQCAVCSPDFRAAYAAVLPSQRHQAVGKDRAKPTPSSGSTIPFARAGVGASVLRFRSQRSLPITLVRSGISFTTITLSACVPSSLCVDDYRFSVSNVIWSSTTVVS
jgi:IS1 family transposase